MVIDGKEYIALILPCVTVHFDQILWDFHLIHHHWCYSPIGPCPPLYVTYRAVGIDRYCMALAILLSSDF